MPSLLKRRLTGGARTPLTAGGTGKGGVAAAKGQTSWRAGNTKIRGPGLNGG